MAKKGTQKSEQSTRLPKGLRNASFEAMHGAQDLYRDPSMGNLPNAYVPMSQERQQAYGLMQQPYNFGSAGQAGLDEYGRVLSGQYLDAGNNPYLQDIVQRSVGEGQRAIGGAFNSAGRYGSGAFSNSAMDAASETASRLYGAQYEAERQRMMQALGQTSQMQALGERLANPQMEEARRLEYVGQQNEADLARRYGEDARQFLWPYMQQQIYESSLGTSPLRQEGNADSTVRTKEPFDWGAMVGGIFSAPSLTGS